MKRTRVGARTKSYVSFFAVSLSQNLSTPRAVAQRPSKAAHSAFETISITAQFLQKQRRRDVAALKRRKQKDIYLRVRFMLPPHASRQFRYLRGDRTGLHAFHADHWRHGKLRQVAGPSTVPFAGGREQGSRPCISRRSRQRRIIPQIARKPVCEMRWSGAWLKPRSLDKDGQFDRGRSSSQSLFASGI